MYGQIVVKFLPSPKQNPYNKSSVLAQVCAGPGLCRELGGEETHPEEPTESTKSEHNPPRGFSCSTDKRSLLSAVGCPPVTACSFPTSLRACCPLQRDLPCLCMQRPPALVKDGATIMPELQNLPTSYFLRSEPRGRESPRGDYLPPCLFSQPLAVSSQVLEERRRELPH